MTLCGVGSLVVTVDDNANPAALDESNTSAELSDPDPLDVSNTSGELSDPVAFDKSNPGAELSDADALVVRLPNAIVVVEHLIAVSRSGLVVVAESSGVWRASEASNMVVVVPRANALSFVRVGSACVLD